MILQLGTFPKCLVPFQGVEFRQSVWNKYLDIFFCPTVKLGVLVLEGRRFLSAIEVTGQCPIQKYTRGRSEILNLCITYFPKIIRFVSQTSWGRALSFLGKRSKI